MTTSKKTERKAVACVTQTFTTKLPTSPPPLACLHQPLQLVVGLVNYKVLLATRSTFYDTVRHKKPKNYINKHTLPVCTHLVTSYLYVVLCFICQNVSRKLISIYVRLHT